MQRGGKERGAGSGTGIGKVKYGSGPPNIGAKNPLCLGLFLRLARFAAIRSPT